MDAQDLIATTLPIVERIGQGLAPDGDWAPVAILDSDSVRQIIGMQLRDETMKRIVYESVLPELIREHGATSVALVNTSWLVEAPSQEDLAGLDPEARAELAETFLEVRPSEHPNRIEVVNVVAFDATGRTIQAMAEIVRSGTHPKLRPWKLSSEGTVHRGLVVDPIVRALARNAVARN